MFCAIHAAKRGRSVFLLDHTAKIGRKILISGGGRCNFTNLDGRPDMFQSENPHFCKSALAQYQPADFISMVEKHRIRYHEKKLGQLFCNEGAHQIVDMLVDECERAGARFLLECKVKSVQKGEKFQIQTSKGDFEAKSLVVATGGLSIPKIGATGFGYELAKQFLLKLVPTAPALVGFNFSRSDQERFGDLPGISFDSAVTCNKRTFRENTLITHGGLSGPAILQASLWWNDKTPLAIDLSPHLDLGQWLLAQKERHPGRELKTILAEIFAARFADRLCELFQASRQMNSLADNTLISLGERLSNWQIVPQSTFGYQKAEVTRGGLSTAELNSKTMEAKSVPGLYFIGEVVDVTGQLGGYNFQWAWSSGFAAGQAV